MDGYFGTTVEHLKTSEKGAIEVYLAGRHILQHQNNKHPFLLNAASFVAAHIQNSTYKNSGQGLSL